MTTRPNMKKTGLRLILIAMAVMVLMTAGALLVPACALAETATPAAPVNIDLTAIVLALLSLLSTIITAKVVPWIKAKTTAQQQTTLGWLVKTGVYGAEQIFGSGHGAEKLQYVKRYLNLHGLDADMTAIEAAVREMTLQPVVHMGVATLIEETVTVETERDDEDEPPDGQKLKDLEARIATTECSLNGAKIKGTEMVVTPESITSRAYKAE